MTPQEKDLITTLLTRLRSAAGQPKDPEADGLIRQAVGEQPDASYYLVQTVLIQDLSLHNAQQRIAELEQQVAALPPPQPASFLGGLFGRNQAPAAPPAPTAGPWGRAPQVAAAPPPGYAQPGYAQPQPGYAQPQPGYAPAGGMFGGAAGGGGGFLRSAAATAAGVAGGALLFEGISSMFGNHYANGLMGGQGGMMPGLGETVVNNYYEGGGQDFGGGGQDFGGGGQDLGGGQDFGGGGQDLGGGQDFGGGDGGGGDFGGGNTSC
jgi:hypothetical protein